MAPINTMSVLAFATAALAVPYHAHPGHSRFHNNKPSGFSAYPLPSANGTGIYPTGTGFATGSPVVPVTETAVVSDVETTTSIEATSTCTSEVTVTTTVKKTVTLPASASSVVVASSSEAAPVESTSESSAPAYSAAPTSYSTQAEPVTQETESAPATTTSASSSVEESSSAASPTMTYSAAKKNIDVNIGYGSSSTSSAAPAYTSSSSSSSNGKRGVAYNDAKLAQCLIDSDKMSWAYNWGSSSSGLSDNIKFIPTLWGTASMFTDSWSDNAKDAIDSGSTHLFSFNEPDLGAQANLSPSEAATAYKKYMEPFAGQAKLCAPSVTNGGGSMGLNWLSSFLESCSDCTIDCINIHWYDSAENVEYFKKHINDAADTAPGKEIFLSEFAATGSDDQISEFLETVMPWMDSNDSVGGYAYFMAGEGALVSGSEASAIGKTYSS